MTGWANRDVFRNRVKEWAGKRDIEVTSVSIRPMRRRWASCSTNGRLNFNDELLQMDRELGGLRDRSRVAALLRAEP